MATVGLAGGAATRVVPRDGARAASAVCAEVHARNGSLCIGIARLRRQGRTGRRELAHTKRKRGPDMVALAAGLILITLLALIVARVDAARSAYWRTVAVRRRLLWERRNAAASDGYVGQRP